MSKELHILSAFVCDRDIFDEYSQYLSGIPNLERELKLLLKVISEYYKEFKQEQISKEELTEYYKLLFPAQRDEQIHLDLIHAMYQTKINNELVAKMLENIVERHVSSVILTKLLPIVEGTDNGKLVDVYKDVEDYIRKLKNPPPELRRLKPCELSLHELIESEINYEGLNWHIPRLDTVIGRAKKKTFGLVYAFVDSGKSSFCLAACMNFARQLVDTDECIVYAGNEEGAPGIALRMTQALLKKTQTQIVEDTDGCEAARAEQGFHKVHLYDDVYTLNDVIWLLEEHRPRVMFVDQAVKVEGDKSDKEMKAVQKLFNAYRELSKTFDTTIIGVAQGRGECEDKKYLKLSDIYGSRVAIQGELDWALGIGRILDPAYENNRYVNIPKNKQGENDKFVTNFERHTCQWEEV